MFAPTSVILIIDRVIFFKCSLDLINSLFKILQGLLIKPLTIDLQQSQVFPGEVCVNKAQKNKYVLGMLRCLVGWSMVGMGEGGTSRGRLEEGILGNTQRESWLGQKRLREMHLSEDSQRGKITTGSKWDNYCFVLIVFSNLVALIF